MLDIAWILCNTTLFIVAIVVIVSNRRGDMGDNCFGGVGSGIGYVVLEREMVDSTAIDKGWPENKAAATPRIS